MGIASNWLRMGRRPCAISAVKRRIWFCLLIAALDQVIGLPDMDGRKVLKQIESDAPDTPVILMTGDASIESATEALKSGAYDYLAKPLEPNKLFITIENALDRNRIEKQRRNAIKKLGESEEKYHQLFESITDAVTVVDAETSRFEDANKATLDLYGYSLEEFCQLTVEDISAEKKKTRKHGCFLQIRLL